MRGEIFPQRVGKVYWHRSVNVECQAAFAPKLEPIRLLPQQPPIVIDPTGLTWYEKKGSNQPEWFDENPGDEDEEVTEFIYQAVNGTWVLLDSNSKKWKL